MGRRGVVVAAVDGAAAGIAVDVATTGADVDSGIAVAVDAAGRIVLAGVQGVAVGAGA